MAYAGLMDAEVSLFQRAGREHEAIVKLTNNKLVVFGSISDMYGGD